MNAMPSGSYLVISHPASDLLSREAKDGLEDLSDRMMRQKVTSRSRAQVARFFAGLDLVAPGLVRIGEWRRVVRGGPQTLTLSSRERLEER